MNTGCFLSWAVVHDVNTGWPWLAFRPFETRPPLPVDPNGKPSCPVTFQDFRPIARQSPRDPVRHSRLPPRASRPCFDDIRQAYGILSFRRRKGLHPPEARQRNPLPAGVVVPMPHRRISAATASPLCGRLSIGRPDKRQKRADADALPGRTILARPAPDIAEKPPVQRPDKRIVEDRTAAPPCCPGKPLFDIGLLQFIQFAARRDMGEFQSLTSRRDRGASRHPVLRTSFDFPEIRRHFPYEFIGQIVDVP